jgi:hypothetical protein
MQSMKKLFYIAAREYREYRAEYRGNIGEGNIGGEYRGQTTFNFSLTRWG